MSDLNIETAFGIGIDLGFVEKLVKIAREQPAKNHVDVVVTGKAIDVDITLEMTLEEFIKRLTCDLSNSPSS